MGMRRERKHEKPEAGVPLACVRELQKAMPLEQSGHKEGEVGDHILVMGSFSRGAMGCRGVTSSHFIFQENHSCPRYLGG